MRVRPFFWFFLVSVCAGILLFATIQHTYAPAVLHIQIRQEQPRATDTTTFELRFTDPQGLPIDEAHIDTSARMTNMQMSAYQPQLKKIGEGRYSVAILLNMAGPWDVVIHAKAPGFLDQQQTLHIKVV